MRDVVAILRYFVKSQYRNYVIYRISSKANSTIRYYTEKKQYLQK